MKSLSGKMSLLLALLFLASGSLFAQSPFLRVLGPNYTTVNSPRTITILGADLQGNVGTPQVCFNPVGTAGGCTVPLTGVSVASSNLLTATFPALGTVQTGFITVRPNFNGNVFSTGGLQFDVQSATTTASAAPVLTGRSIAQAVVGSGDTSITLTGSGFTPPLDVVTGVFMVTPDGFPQELTTTSITNAQIQATIPAGLLDTVRSYYIYVQIQGQGGTRITSLLSFNVVPPTLSTLSPPSAVAGRSTIDPFVLTGSFATPGTGATASAVGFTPPGATTATLLNLSTAADTGTRLERILPASLLTTPGNASVQICSLPGRVLVCSNAVTFTILPPPSITSVTPNSAVAGAGNTQITIAGASFLAGGPPSVVFTLGQTITNLTVNSATSTSIVATIPSTLLTAAGTASISVISGVPSTTAGTFTIFPAPTLQSVFPSDQFAGVTTATTVYLYGTSLIGGGTTTVRWTRPGGTPQTLTIVGTPTDTFITATIPPNLVTTTGTATIQIVKGGVASNGLTFTILPSPVITSLNPRGVPAGSPDTVMTISGQNLVAPGSRGLVVNFGATRLFPTSVTPTQAVVTIPAAALATAAQVPVTAEFLEFQEGFGQSASGAAAAARAKAAAAGARIVAAAGRDIAEVGPVSNVLTFSVLGPITVTTTFPTWIQSGSANTQLVVTGTGFDNGSVVLFNGTALSTVFNSATQVTATIPAAQLTTAGDRTVAVRDSFNRTSNNVTLPVIPPIQISTLSPSFAEAGSPAFTLTVNGSGFESNHTVTFNNVNVPTAFVSANQLTASVPSTLLTPVGNVGVTVRDTRGRISSSSPFSIVTPLQLTSTVPSRANAGISGFTINVSGQGFTTGSVIRFNGGNIATNFLSPTSLTGQVPANLLLAAGAAEVRVQLLDGRLSNAVSFTILPQLLISAVNPPGSSAAANTLTVTVTGQGFTNESVVRLAGLGLQTTFVSDTQLTALISDTLLERPAALEITVANPLGAVSNALPFGVGAANLTVTSVSPATAAVNSQATPIIVTGSGFTSGTVLRFGQTEIPTQFVSATQLNGTIPPQLLTTAGTFPITAALGLSVSNPFNFQVGSGPEITFLNPNSITAGANRFTLIVLGRSFVNGATIRFGDQDLTTTFASSTQVSAPVPAELIATARTVPVTVVNPDGQASNSADFRIVTLSLTSISPDRATVGSAGFTLSLEGTGFIQGASVSFGGTGLITTFGGATRLSAAVPASALTNPGTIRVTVSNPDGARSNPVDFTVEGDTPTISRLNPASVVAGSGEVTVNVIGGGFNRGSSVTANGQSLATSFNSSTSLDAVVPAELTATIRTLQFKVTNPGNRESNEVGFQVTAPVPAISRITPGNATVGRTTDLTIAITGTGFVQGSSVQFNGSGIETEFGSATSLTAVIPASAFAAAGNATVRVSNPGNLLSNAVQFQILAPVTVTAVSPSTIVAGGTQNITIGVTGTGFLNGAAVNFNGNALATTFNSATSLSAVLPPSLTATAGTFAISVSNPNGAESNSVSLRIDAPIPTPPLNLQVPATITPAGTGRVQVTLDGNAPVTITGTLLLTFVNNSNNAPNGYIDPALVFAGSGSRTINFTIPAGSPNAVIANDGAFSPGTVAGTIVVTMTSLTGGGQNLLPSPAPTRNIVIDRGIPVVVAGSVRITNITGGFQVELAGVSSVRDLRSITFNFTSTGVTILEGSSVTVDVSQIFTTFFASAPGQQSGGAFRFTMPFTVSGGDANAVTQVSVTLTNSVGTSAAVSGGR